MRGLNTLQVHRKHSQHFFLFIYKYFLPNREDESPFTYLFIKKKKLSNVTHCGLDSVKCHDADLVPSNLEPVRLGSK